MAGRLGAGEFGEGAGEALGVWGGLRVFDRGAVSAHVDGIHDGERAADAEQKAEEAADGGGPKGGGHGCKSSSAVADSAAGLPIAAGIAYLFSAERLPTFKRV